MWTYPIFGPQMPDPKEEAPITAVVQNTTTTNQTEQTANVSAQAPAIQPEFFLPSKEAASKSPEEKQPE